MWILRGLYLILSVSANLVFIAEVTRHGARAPSKLWPFNEKYWNEDQLEQLTEYGMKQLYELGERMRLKYPSIFDRYDTQEIDLLTSPSSRAVMSAYAHAAGLYPEGPEWLRKFNGAGDPNTLYGVLPEFPEDSPIKIAQGSDLHAVRGHDITVCPRIKQIKELTAFSSEYQSINALWRKTLFPTLSQALGFQVSSISEVNSLGSAIDCEYAAGRQNLNLSFDLYNEIFKVRKFQMNHVPFSSPEAQSLASSGFFRRLIGQVEGALGGSGLKYAYYSSHDYTLVGYLNSLKAKHQYTPYFASSLVFEIYDNRTVRLLYNHEPLILESCSGECTWEELKEVMQKHLVEDIEKACEVRLGMDSSSPLLYYS